MQNDIQNCDKMILQLAFELYLDDNDVLPCISIDRFKVRPDISQKYINSATIYIRKIKLDDLYNSSSN